MIPSTLCDFVLHSDQRAIQRHAVNERLRAVDRIENPAATARARPVRKFFAQNGVVGKGRRDPLSQQLLGLPVGDGDGRGIRFAFDGQIVALEIVQREPAGLGCGGPAHFQPVRKFRCIHAINIQNGLETLAERACNSRG